MAERTLEDIEREYEIVRKELEPIEIEYKKGLNKLSELSDEMEQYKLQHGLYMPMSELEKHMGEKIDYIRLVVRDENGELDTKDFGCDEYFSVDENGHLDYSSYDFGVMFYDNKINKYKHMYYYSTTIYNFVGILEVEFGNEED